ncbi:MAG: hypothetical protein RLZZ230_40 [Candidatus Parcubacteria bacterium]|jgi:membrane protein YqaA with SNARE-associated domain
MSLEKDLEIKLEEVLHADSVTKAKRIMRSRSGVVMVGIISFIESALPLPILTDPFLIAAILVERTNAVRLVVVTIITSVLGGVFAYFTAAMALNLLMQWLPAGALNDFNQLMANNQSSAFTLAFVGAFTPVPYTAAAWAVAVMKGSIWAFIAASIIGRGARYIIVGYSVYRFGPLATTYVKRYIGILSLLLIVIALAYFIIRM